MPDANQPTLVYQGSYRSGARTSACGKYRYLLYRRVGKGERCLNFLMLNPSTAGAFEDDNTIRRCSGYTLAWGFDYFLVTNLFACKATDPKDILKFADPVGPANDAAIVAAAT